MLSEADELSIRRLHDAWIEAEQRGDADAVLNLCTEDVEWLPPAGPPISGRDAGRDLLLMPAIRVLSIHVTDFVVVEGAEGRATKTCRYETVFEVTDTRLRGIARGTHTWKLQQGAHGWRVASVSWLPDAVDDNACPSTSASVG